VSRDLVHVQWHVSVFYGQTDWGFIRSNEVTVPTGEAFDGLVHFHPSPHLCSQVWVVTERRDRVNELLK